MRVLKKPVRGLILLMISIVFLGIVISSIYYSRINQSVDPRIVPARELYARYDELAQQNQFNQVFKLLDSVESIYNTLPHYKDSYESGVIYNNRAAAFITMAINKDSLVVPAGSAEWKLMGKDQLLNLAEEAVQTSIRIYEQWLGDFSGLSEEEISGHIRNNFLTGLTEFSDDRQLKYVERRVDEITDAQLETPRRLSVSYTNLGIIHRHRENYEDAILNYQRAIELWGENLAAENNLNLLLGRPVKKRTFIQKMFPKERID